MGILRTNEISGLETPTPVTGSVLFDGDGDYLTLAASNDFFPDTYDFTIEWFQYWNSLSGFQDLLDINYTTGLLIETSGSGTGRYRVYADSNNICTESSSAVTGKWYHYAVVGDRNDTATIKIYRNGIETASGSWATNTNVGSASHTLSIGCRANGTNPVDGYVSNFRFLKGTALYTSNFTPPVHELQPIGDTVLLCCNNPDSAGAEATGKTITVNGDAAASTFSPGLTRDFTFGTQFQGVAKFDTQGYFVPPSGTTEQRGRGRGVFGGGYAPGNINTIAYIEIQTQGNALDFGDLSATARRGPGCVTNSTRAVWMGGVTTPVITNIMDFVTIASTGNAVDFGDAQDERRNFGSVASNTRGVFGNGITPAFNAILDFITIGSLGTTTTFGDSSENRGGTTGSACSPTRGLFAGGYTPGSSDTIDYITIATTGNAQDFGNLTIASRHMGGASSSTRGVFSGGNGPANENFIEFVTIATTGNAQDFGDLTQARENIASASNSLRGVFYGGIANPTQRNTIDFVTISTTGNALDFGDAIVTTQQAAGGGDSHGGL